MTDIIKTIYKNKEYTNFTILFDKLIEENLEDPNSTYEFELRLVDNTLHTPKEFFKSFQNYNKISLVEIEDNIIITHKPTPPIIDLIFRSYLDLNDAEEIKNEDDLKHLDSYLYETKESLIRVIPNNFITYPISPVIKYSLEKKVNKFELPVANLQRRLRSSYKHLTLPFKFDFTLRYFSNLNNLVDQYNALIKLYLNQDDISNPNNKNNFTLILDLEIEYTNDNFKDIKNNFYLLLDEIYKIINNNNDSKYKFNPVYQEILELYDLTKSPQVSVLNNTIIQTRNVNEFVWLEKTDGIRHLLLFYKNKIYSYSNVDKIVELTFEYTSDITKLTVLDTELYDDTFKIFDVSMIEGQSVAELNFEERIKKFDIIKSKFNCKNIELKKYYKLEDWKEIILFVENLYKTEFISPISKDKIDGIIIQEINLPYLNIKTNQEKTNIKNVPISYKLKPYRMNTIDFKLNWIKNEQRYYLSLRGRPSELIYNLKTLPRSPKYSTLLFNYDIKKLEKNNQYDIIFDSPYKENLYYFKPRSTFNLNGYTENLSKEIIKIMNDMLENPKKYDSKIVEMSLAEDGWVPLKVRFDKEYSNSYRVGLSNAALLFSPPTYTNEVYFTRDKLSFDEHLIDTFHNVNRAIRTYIFDKLFNNNEENDSYLLQEYNTCVDLAGGRGGDLLHLYNSGCKTIFAIDADKEALITYTQKASLVQNRNIDHILRVINKNLNSRLTFNAIYGILSGDNSLIRNDLYNRKEYKENNVDLVVMNYAFHYICNSYPAILELRNDVKKMLTSDGLFLLTFYDGDSIYKSIQSSKNNEIKLAEFTIKEHKHKYETNDIIYENLSKEMREYISKKQLEELVEVLDINSKTLLEFKPKDIISKYNYLILDTRNKKYEIIFKNYYSSEDKKELSRYIEEIFSNKYERNPWALMPLPTISSEGYREEPLVLSKYLKFLLQEFEIIEEFNPLQSKKLTEYLNKNKIDDYLNEYLMKIKTLLLRIK